MFPSFIQKEQAIKFSEVALNFAYPTLDTRGLIFSCDNQMHYPLERC